MRIEDCATSLFTASKTPGADCGRGSGNVITCFGPRAHEPNTFVTAATRFSRRDVAMGLARMVLVRMQVSGMPGHEVLPRDGLHCRVGHLPRERRFTAVHQLAEFATGNRSSGRRSGGRCLTRCHAGPPRDAPGRTAAAAGRRRRTCSTSPEVLLEHTHPGRTAIVADALTRWRRRDLRDKRSRASGVEGNGAARLHLRSGQARHAILVCRLEKRPGAEACGHAHERQFVVLHHSAPRGRWADRPRRPWQRKGRQAGYFN